MTMTQQHEEAIRIAVTHALKAMTIKTIKGGEFFGTKQERPAVFEHKLAA